MSTSTGPTEALAPASTAPSGSAPTGTGPTGTASGGSTRHQPEKSSGGESTITVVVALGANVLIAIAKGIAAIISGSSSMAAEAAHSVADSINEILLLTALRRSGRAPDREHPLGYGQVRYFWALLAALSIFVTGALFSAFEGVEALLGESGPLESPTLNYVVLAISFVLEGTSLVRGVVQTRREAAEHHLSLRAFLRTTDDPTAATVVFEDSAALVGLLIAAAGNVAHQVTGSSVWDGIASLLIAAVLAAVAVRMGRSNARLLSGVQADPRLVRAILVHLGDEPEVEAVVDLVTVQLGTDEVLVCARLDLDDALDAAQVERAMVRIGEGLRQAQPDVREVFLEPVPRHDEAVRARVRERYGDALAQRMVNEAEDGLPASG